jgi:NAD(P)-dependent dehydrogenase (short-subunit alcohol dehydrogenase family)
MDLQIAGKVALLVGGRGTLGQACARLLRDEQATVVIADQPMHAESQDRLSCVDLDVTSEASVRGAIAQVVRDHQRIDILVCLAGVYHGGTATSISQADFDRVLAINLTGTFLVCREVLPLMQGQDFGRIICLASLAGQVGGVVAGANYSASKAGVLSLVKTFAKQSTKPWITVNAINPGPVEGAMTGSWTPEERDGLRRMVPLRRFATPDEVAAAVVFLASPRAAFIHGAHLDINGGLYMD